METNSTSVLVVGGGLVGLSSAMFLAWRGVPTVLVERRPQSSLHPRAIGFTPRTLELLRAVGLGQRVPQVAPGFRLRRVRVESLAGAWFEEAPWSPDAHATPPITDYSPCSGAAIAQDRLEPILRDRAVELGAELRLGTELVRLEQDGDGVTAWLRDRDGRDHTLRAAYVIAADGHRSPVRTALGIGRSGRGPMRTVRSVMFRAALDEYLGDGVAQFTIDQSGLQAFLTTYGDGRWVLMFTDDEERDETTLQALVARAIGRSDVAIDLVTTGRWELSALIADRFAQGRVFLAGDAAHTLPPSRGGFGANTGIEDAHNLAWKLAAVLAGSSSPALLDSYDAERRPIAWLRHQQIFARDDYQAEGNGVAHGVAILDDIAMELGQLYRSTAVLGAGPELAPARRPDEWAGQPGTRAPHLWLPDGSSTLDRLQRGWVLVTGDERWVPATAAVAAALGVTLTSSAASGDVRAAFGLDAGGAALVRPDGYIAWRAPSLPPDPRAALADALRRVSSATR
jgi:2-polyprenyl-6-methoxyphenol hydroxylase-like FAD-dependent oxidoreductase